MYIHHKNWLRWLNTPICTTLSISVWAFDQTFATYRTSAAFDVTKFAQYDLVAQ